MSWHDIRIADAGGHRRNISPEFPALESKWAKSCNLSRGSLTPTRKPVLFKRPARYTKAYSRRTSLVPRQSEMMIPRPDFVLSETWVLACFRPQWPNLILAVAYFAPPGFILKRRAV